MEKKIYKAPIADKLEFDYKDTVTASDGGEDASHCFGGRNQGQCLASNWKKCGGTKNPGKCHT